MNKNPSSEIEAFFFMDYLVRFSQGVTNFRIPGLNNEVHFSKSHHPNSDKFNFHVTRNTSDTKTKPKIVVCDIAKVDLHTWLNMISGQLYHLLFEEIPITYLRKAKYIPFDKMKWLGRESAEVMNSIGQYKKRKLKLPPTLFGSIENHLKAPSVRYRLEQAFQPFPIGINLGYQSGIYWKDADVFPVLITPSGCYRQRENVEADTLLDLLPDQKLARRIKLKTALAVKLVSTAITRQELADLVRPVNISVSIRGFLTA